MASIAEAPRVRQISSTVNYIARKPEPLYNYYLVDPPAGVAASNEDREPRDVIVASVRDRTVPPALDVHGFELVAFNPSVDDIYDTAQQEAVFNPQVADFVRRHLNAREVRVFFPFLRGEEAQRRMPGSLTAPAPTAHVDYTHETGHYWFDHILGADADRYRGSRFAIINLWRPITGPLRDHPLAMCDAQSLGPDDLMVSKVVSRADEHGRPVADGKIYEAAVYALAYNPGHRWYYVPDMMPDEALLLKNYDSQLDGVARFSPHCAFKDPSTPADVLPRASIEVRCLVVW